MNESGFSLNFRMLDKHGVEVQITMRGPDVCDWQLVLRERNLMIEAATKYGWKPLEAHTNGNGNGSSPNGDLPICEFHGAMRKGNHGYFCPKKMGDGSYCKSKA